MARKSKSESEQTVVDNVEDAQRLGFVGRKVDPLPNETYTMQGQATEPMPTADDPADPAVDPAVPGAPNGGES